MFYFINESKLQPSARPTVNFEHKLYLTSSLPLHIPHCSHRMYEHHTTCTRYDSNDHVSFGICVNAAAFSEEVSVHANATLKSFRFEQLKFYIGCVSRSTEKIVK